MLLSRAIPKSRHLIAPAFHKNVISKLQQRKMSTKSELTPEVLSTLKSYTACDISDALQKLKVPKAGFIADLVPYSPSSNPSQFTWPKIQIAPASTVQFIPKSSSGADLPPSNIPSDTHWVDHTTPETFLVSSQPAGQTNAVLGGIMAARITKLKGVGVIVHGRIRDLDELQASGLTIWAKGTSTVGTGADTKAWSVNVDVDVGGVVVKAGDFVFSDVENGVVVIPREMLGEVLELLPVLTAKDEKVKEAVEGGMSVHEAIAKFR